MKWKKKSPRSTPDENGYKILVFSKLSKTKWFQNSEMFKEDFRIKYSIAVDVKAKEDNDLRSKIRQKLQIRLRV